MELTQIKYFLEVAKTQHMTESAMRLHIAQPALSRTIHKLEKELGVKLFEAKGRNIVLTECGKLMRDRLSPILAELDEIPEMLKAFSRLYDGTIHLSVLAASSLVTRAVIDFKSNHEDMNFQLIQNDESELSDIEITSEMPGHSYSCEANRFICHERIFLAVPNRGRFREIESVTLKELENEKFISLLGSKQFRAVCDRFCRQAEINPRIIFESDNLASVKNMIAANIGVGFWPEFSWGKVESDRVKLLEIREPKCGRDIKITLSKKATNDVKKTEFFEFLKESFLSAKKDFEAEQKQGAFSESQRLKNR